MAIGSFKTLLFAFLALFLGAGQAVCASMMPAVSSAGIAASAHHQTMSDAQGGAAHDHHQQSGHDGSAHRAPKNNDCEYCAAAHKYKALTKSEQSVSIALAAVVKVIDNDALPSNPHSGYAQKKRFVRLWRDQRAQTPVSLKIRLLI